MATRGDVSGGLEARELLEPVRDQSNISLGPESRPTH